MNYFLDNTNILNQDPIVKIENDTTMIQSKNLLPATAQIPVYNDLLDIIESESDGQGLLFSAFKSLDLLYPDLPSYAEILTDDEIDQHFQSLVKMIGHNANYKFIQVWSSSFTGERDRKKELLQKVLDIESTAFRRKYFGSYLGYKSSFNIIFKHGGVFPTMMYNKPVYDSDYERLARLVNYYHDGSNSSVIDKFLPWSPNFISSYPETGLVEGFKDSILFKNQYLNGSYLVSSSLGSILDPSLRTSRLSNLITTKDTKSIFLDMTINGLLFHPRSGVANSNADPCLLDSPWLEFIEKESLIAKRASNDLKIGSQMTIILDTSGYFNVIGGTSYTHTDTKIKAFIFRQNYLGISGSSNITKIVLGAGDGSSKTSWFKSIDDAQTVPLFGGNIYNDQPFVDPTKLNATAQDPNLTLISPNCELPLFESNISFLEKFENVASDFSLISPTVYSQTLKNAWDNSLKTAKIIPSIFSGSDSLIMPMYTQDSELNPDFVSRIKNATHYLETNEYGQALAVYYFGKNDLATHGIVESLSSTEELDTTLQKISNIETTIDLYRSKIAKGSLNIYIIVKPPIYEASLPFVKISDESEIGYHFELTPIDIKSVSYGTLIDGITKTITFTHDDLQAKVPIGKTLTVAHMSPSSYNKPYIVHSSTTSSVTVVDDNTSLVTKNGYFSTIIDFERIEDFNKDFWIDGSFEKVNPFWQYINIYDHYENSTWKQVVKILKKIKVVSSTGSHYSYDDLTASNEKLYYITPTLNYFPKIGSGGGVNDRYVELVKSGENDVYAQIEDVSNTYTGIVKFILHSNQNFSNVVDSYLSSYNNLNHIKYFENKSSYGYYGIHITQNSGLSETLTNNYLTKNITYFSSNSAPESPVFGSYNFVTNTTQSMINLSDSSSAKVEIRELALFNDLGQIVMYANFPPVIYDSSKNHMSFNIFIKKTSISV